MGGGGLQKSSARPLCGQVSELLLLLRLPFCKGSVTGAPFPTPPPRGGEGGSNAPPPPQTFLPPPWGWGSILPTKLWPGHNIVQTWCCLL